MRTYSIYRGGELYRERKWITWCFVGTRGANFQPNVSGGEWVFVVPWTRRHDFLVDDTCMGKPQGPILPTSTFWDLRVCNCFVKK